MARGNQWIGVDFDASIAEYHGWQGEFVFGAPIPKMIERVKNWLAVGKRVKIFTARVAVEDEDLRARIVTAIQDWTEEHVGARLEVTNIKDFELSEYYDDRAVQLIANTGEIVGHSTRE